MNGLHDFAFQTGFWRVRHRKRAQRLVGDESWIAFEGTCRAYALLGGAGNVDDFFIDDPAGAYRAATFRRLDPATGDWSIHWTDLRRPGLDAPMVGRFDGGIGTFYGRDKLHGCEIQVRFLWSGIGPATARWEQAFSFDGQDWEVNWIMDFDRLADPGSD